jgi:arylsulfatase
VIPTDAQLTERHAEIPGWDEMDEAFKPVLRRQMENYAGFLEQTDHHVGRVVQVLGDLGVLHDTLVYYIIGENGASAEGTLNGSFNEYIMANALAAMETPAFLMDRLGRWGTEES